MTTGVTDKLSVEEVEKYAKGRMKSMPFHIERELARQLADTMRENELLRDTLTIIDMQAMNVMQDDVPPYGAILKCGWVHEKCKEALQRNKEPSDVG